MESQDPENELTGSASQRQNPEGEAEGDTRDTDNQAGKTPKNALRDGQGRWEKGSSGNPKGRPAGARNHSTEMLKAMLEGQGPQLLQAIFESAVQGHIVGAQRLLLERLLPPLRQRPIPLPIARLEKEGPAAAISELLKAVVAGEIAPEEAESVTRMLLAQQQASAVEAFEGRLAALEQKLGGGSSKPPWRRAA